VGFSFLELSGLENIALGVLYGENRISAWSALKAELEYGGQNIT
jgi:hypothetical protein